jgi:exodeoxyribonuclease V alpha subunit
MAEQNPTTENQSTSYPLDTVTGILERITYHNEENGYTVARLAVEGARDLLTIVGSFSHPIVGEQLFLEGRWGVHREYGRQFQVERYNASKPATALAIEKYLGSGLIKGIGPVMAKRMVELFGLETLEIIENEPRQLLKVEGIGEKRIVLMQKAWHEQREIRNVMLFLQGKGVSATFAVKIYKTYGDRALQVVEENPYRLAQDIWGIGFKTADKIAQQLGVALDSERRLEAGLLYTLSEATEFGHLYLPEPKLLQSAAEILSVEVILLLPVLEAMAAAQTILTEDLPGATMGDRPLRACYHPALYYTEIGLAAQIRRRLLLPPEKPLSRAKIALWLDAQETAQSITLSEEQREAVALALEHRVFVLTGGPGCGKTTVTNMIVRAFERQRKRILLVSPTGRAAKRLSEVTGREAQTIHRLLKFDPASRTFQFNESNPLPCDVLIADEVSMLDAVLANNLLKAVPEQAQVVFVGDSDQLPSVGAGNVLGDMLASGVVPSIRLTQVFRQAQSSLIVTNAHAIREGKFPQLIPPKKRNGQNCLWIEIEENTDEAVSSAALGAQKVVQLVRKSLPALGYQGDAIQVLAPVKRGSLGVDYLNELLQEALNPADPTGRKPEFQRGSRRFRVGDRVIQLVNNYDRNVFNGDVGTIAGIDPEDQILKVRFPEGTVEYDFSDYDELQLAYCLSVHKAQGSEYKAVVLVMHSSQYMMLQRNLLYTGLTRARDLCLLVGDRRAIGRAVRNNRTTRRYTRLAERLQDTREETLLPPDRLL